MNVGVIVFLLSSDGYVFLIRRAKNLRLFPGLWALPGRYIICFFVWLFSWLVGCLLALFVCLFVSILIQTMKNILKEQSGKLKKCFGYTL